MNYEDPSMEVILLKQYDVIRTSGEEEPDLDPDGWGGGTVPMP